jgi:hypothetical protein
MPAEPGLAFDARGQLSVERVDEVGSDQADAVGASGPEHGRGRMPLESELVDDLPDARGGGRADPRLGVDDSRDGLDRHVRAARHVRHRRAVWPVVRRQVCPVR